MPGWRLVVGLGNPGEEYADTRHNLGFMVVDRLIERCLGDGGGDRDMGKSARRSFTNVWNDSGAMVWTVADADDRRSRRAVIKPSTFMNRSGMAVAEALDTFVGASLDDVLVVIDDLSLPLGAIRLRARGSDGGHNGLKSVAAVIGRNDFARLRVGIGPQPEPSTGRAQVDFVLGAFTDVEAPALAIGLDRAVQTTEAWLRGEALERIMNEANQRSPR